MRPIDELPRVPAPRIGANTEFVDALVRADARFLIVGGVAVKFYVPQRAVEDLDLLVERTKGNASKVLTAVSSSPLFRRNITVGQLIRPKLQICVKMFECYMDILTPGPDLDFIEAWTCYSCSPPASSPSMQETVRRWKLWVAKQRITGSIAPQSKVFGEQVFWLK